MQSEGSTRRGSDVAVGMRARQPFFRVDSFEMHGLCILTKLEEVDEYSGERAIKAVNHHVDRGMLRAWLCWRIKKNICG